MSRSHCAAGALLAAVLLLGAGGARAALFEDDEARKAILELRARVTQNEEQQRARQTEREAQQAQTAEQLQQLRRSLLDLNTEIQSLRGEIAALRGQKEQLAREVADLQRAQKDIAQGVDERIRKLEPQKVTLDGREFRADQDEKRQYDESIALLRSGDFDKASVALAAFVRRYPSSGFTEPARFWLGNALYGKRQYPEAIAAFRAFVTAVPDHPRAPEALLAIANCQAEMKDTKAARRTLDELLKAYPKSEAAVAAKERLASLK